MTNLLLFLILVTQLGILFMLKKILKATPKDFSFEDAQVKAMTEQIAEAKQRLPHQEK